MKNICKMLKMAALAAVPFLTIGCIDEVEPTSLVTSEQLSENASTTEVLLWGMPAFMSAYNVTGGGGANDYGIGTIMHILDIMGEDYVVTPHFYDWYSSWSYNESMGETSSDVNLVWTTLYKSILTTNMLIGNIDSQTDNSKLLQYLAAGYAFRASLYLDAARMYEFLPNDGTSQINADGKDVFGLTVPFVFDATDEYMARRNPRAFHTEAFGYIRKDLECALNIFAERGCIDDKTLPGYYATCGILARAYMWHGSFLKEFGEQYDRELTADECFATAERYAKKAQEGGTPLTESQWTDVSMGFNSFNDSWLWGFTVSKESDAVRSAYDNRISWVSNEVSYGYAGVGPYIKVDKQFYERISPTDFRKLSWKAPRESELYERVSYCDKEIFDRLPDYAALKIRPGQGEVNDYNIASAVSVPFMRVEEMYFIEMEAVAQRGQEDDAIALLQSFMQKYRAPGYQYSASDIIDEIFFQKRVELWGEGRNYFDYKRLNKGVVRNYEGTQFGAAAQMNTRTRPAWMNFVIHSSETSNNDSIRSYNNPDPSDCYTKGETQ